MQSGVGSMRTPRPFMSAAIVALAPNAAQVTVVIRRECSKRVVLKGNASCPGGANRFAGGGVQHPGRTVTPIGTVMKLRPLATPAKTCFTREMDERILGRKRRYFA